MGILSMFPGGLAKTSGQYAWAKFAEKPTLPIGFTPLESIALTGSNYFILDYIVTTANFAKLKVVADIAITGTSSNNYRIDGCAASSGHFYFGIASNGQYGYSVGSDATTGVTADTSRHTHTLDVPNKKYTVDSVVNITTNPNTSQTINKPFVIGGYYDTGYSDMHVTHGETIWSYKFYENDVLVRNYIPVLDIDGIACLYDTVTGIKVYASGTGDVVSGSAGNKVQPDEYVLGDDANAYPQDEYHADGYYYKKLYSDIPWDETGRYVWAKTQYADPVGFDIDASYSSLTITQTGNTYNIKTAASTAGWNIHRSASAVFDTTVQKIVFEYTIKTTAACYLAIADTAATNNSYYNFALYMYSGALYRYVSNASKGTVGTFSVGDVIKISIKGNEAGFYKNGDLLYNEWLGFTDAYFCFMGNAVSTEYGDLTVTHEELISYVLSDNENAYPDYGYGDDGFYYVKVGATKITPIYRDIKYASGTVTGSYPNTINITGLDFTPVAVGVAVTSSIPILGFGLSAGAFNVAYSGRNAAIATSFSASNGQFSITVTGGTAYTSSLTYYWWAIGY